MVVVVVAAGTEVTEAIEGVPTLLPESAAAAASARASAPSSEVAPLGVVAGLAAESVGTEPPKST